MYAIWGKYKYHNWEKIDSFDSKLTTSKMLTEYRVSFGNDWIFKIKSNE